MDIERLQDFLAVAECLNLTAAARTRHTTQSNLSKRLKSLEAWLGTELVDRNSRPLRLTPDGEDFVPKARLVVDEMQSSRKRAMRPAPDPIGDIRIAMPHSGSVEIFPRFKQRVLTAFPELSFMMLFANHDVVGKMLNRSECDLALAYRHPEVPTADEFLVYRPVTIAEDLMVVVSRDGGLSDHDHAFVPHRCIYLGQIWHSFSGFSLPEAQTEMALPADIRAHALAGRGVGVVPLGLVESDLATGRLGLIDCPYPLRYDVGLYCAPRASRKARTLWAALAADADGEILGSPNRAPDSPTATWTASARSG